MAKDECSICKYTGGTHWPYCSKASEADVENLRPRGGGFYEAQLANVRRRARRS